MTSALLVDQVIVPSSALCFVLSYALSVIRLHVMHFDLYLADPPSKIGGSNFLALLV